MRHALWVGFCVACVMAGCDAPTAARKGEKQAARVYEAGQPIDLAPMRVVFTRAVPTQVDSDRNTFWRVLQVEFTAENTSPVKVVEWRGWAGRGRATDEHGNVFRANHLGTFAHHARALADAIDDGRRYDPGEKATRHVYFDRPPVSSKRVEIVLPLSVIDPKDAGEVRIRLPVEHPK